MPSSLRARSSTAATPSLRSRTSAASAALRSSRPEFSRRWSSTCAASAVTSPALPMPNQSRYCSHPSRTTSPRSTHRNTGDSSALQRDEGGAAGVAGRTTQGLPAAQQLVVLGHAVAAAKRTGLDLGRGGGDRNIRDRGVLGLARTMRYDRGVVGLVRHGDGVQGLAQGADLVDLDQDRVGGTRVDALL